MIIFARSVSFAGLGVTGGATGDAVLVVAGVLLGSTTWWVVLTTVIGTVRTRVTPLWIHPINLVSGAILGAFALVVDVASTQRHGHHAPQLLRIRQNLRGSIPGRRSGVLIASEAGPVTPYALDALAHRGASSSSNPPTRSTSARSSVNTAARTT